MVMQVPSPNNFILCLNQNNFFSATKNKLCQMLSFPNETLAFISHRKSAFRTRRFIKVRRAFVLDKCTISNCVGRFL